MSDGDSYFRRSTWWGMVDSKLSEELFCEEYGRGKPVCCVTPVELFAFVAQD